MNMPVWFSNLIFWSAQVALLALAAGFLTHLFKIRQPGVLLVYWRALIGISLLLPFAQPWHRTQNFVPITIAPGVAGPISNFSPIPTPIPAETHWNLPSVQTIAQIIGLIILAGIAVRFVILALGILKLRQFRRASSAISTPAESAAVLDEMRSLVDCRAEFRLSADVNSPVTFGFSAPVILLPENFTSMDSRFQTAIACHELLHVRRHDWAHHLSEEILRTALWFHPAIAWLIRRVRLAREQVVDFEVVRLTEARKPYLEALLAFTTSTARTAAIPAPPFLAERQLTERVALMLKEVHMSRKRLIASLTATACSLILTATLAVWAFPLKAAPRPAQDLSQAVVTQGVSGGATGGVAQGVPGGIAGGVVGGNAANGPTRGVQGGVSGGVSKGAPVTPTHSYTYTLPASQPQQKAQVISNVVVADLKIDGEVHNKDAVEARILKGLKGREFDSSKSGWLDEFAEVNIRGDFQNRGYFEAVVTGEPIAQSLDPVRHLVLVIVHVNEGDQFSAGEISIVNADPARALVIPEGELRQQMQLRTGDVLNVQQIRDGIEAMTRRYGARGYANATIVPQFMFDRKHHSIAATFHVHEGNQYHVESFHVLGLDSKTIQNLESRMQSGSVFDWTLLQDLFNQGNTALSTNVSWGAAVHVTRNAARGTLDITLDFSGGASRPAQQENETKVRGTVLTPIRTVQAVYPADARAKHIEGTVVLMLTVNAEGKVSSMEVVSGPPELAQAAKDAAAQWAFPPPAKAPAVTTASFEFELFPSSAIPSWSSTPMPSDGFDLKIFTSPGSKSETTSFYVGKVKTQTIYAPNPPYPPLARQMHLSEATVTLAITMDSEGSVIEIQLVKSTNPIFVQPAMDTVRTWKIKGTHDGVPVSFQMPVELKFNLF
jgi:TonB family protein